MTFKKSTNPETRRRGIISVLAAFLVVVVFAFVAFAIDTSRISATQNNMQNAVDAAALAAAQEVNYAIQQAAESGSSASDANSIAVGAARTLAQQVAAANGVYINPGSDVVFGKRTYNSGAWTIQWGAAPYNVIKVTARRDQGDLSAADGQFPMTFGWAVGKPSVTINTTATAFVEARDLVLCMDYSGSMNDDSTIGSFSLRGQSNVETNLDEIWNALVTANPKFPGTTKSKSPSAGFGGVNSAVGTYVSSSTTSTIFSTLNLGATDASGNLLNPFRQAGRNSNGSFKNMPSASASQAAWNSYISYVKNHSNATYKKKYGFRTLMDYLMTQKADNASSEDLWRTPHYPFHAVKDATTLFLDFVDQLDFGDEIGYVNYATTPRTETSLNEDGYNIDISSDPITPNFSDINIIQRHKQAGHYTNTTGTGDGILQARSLLTSNMRFGSRPTILLMSDGLANVHPSGWSLPGGWNWAAVTDFNGDGVADYSTTDISKQYAFYQAKQAVDAGYTLHTLSVGLGADAPFMEALAFMGGGISITVPGNSTVAQMQSDLLAAFAKIAAKVPPPKLVDAGN